MLEIIESQKSKEIGRKGREMMSEFFEIMAVTAMIIWSFKMILEIFKLLGRGK